MALTKQNILKAKILVVDDDEISVRLLEEILHKAGYKHIKAITDSRLVKDTYGHFRPELVLLDLKMPHFDGFQVMEQLKEFEQASYLPILVLSQEESQEARWRALESGAKDFLHKPYDRMEVLVRIQNLIEVRMLHNQIRQQNELLEVKVRERTKDLQETRLDVIRRLAAAAEYRDNETGLHVIRMSQYCVRLAAAIGFTEPQRELLLMASPLHDIGKIAIPDSILLKPGKLDPDEWEIMKTHTIIGGELLAGSNSPFLKMAESIAITHHEKWNGSGYPKGLKKEDIPLVGRISGLCDVFDALTSKRPYKPAWSFKDAVEEIVRLKGEHFDPNLVKTFLDILPEIEGIMRELQDKKS